MLPLRRTRVCETSGLHKVWRATFNERMRDYQYRILARQCIRFGSVGIGLGRSAWCGRERKRRNPGRTPAPS